MVSRERINFFLKNILFLKFSQDNISNLEHDPVSVEECVEHLLLINQINHDLADLEVEFNVVNKLFSLIRLYEMKINEESLALYMTLAPSFQLMKVSIFCFDYKTRPKMEHCCHVLVGGDQSSLSGLSSKSFPRFCKRLFIFHYTASFPMLLTYRYINIR